jgi:hypothetical protein
VDEMSENGLFETVCADVLPVFRKLSATEKYAIALGGSRGKGQSDRRSDYDFRVYYEAPVPDPEWGVVIAEVFRKMEKWQASDVIIDGCWPRSIGEIDSALNAWLSGQISTIPYSWTIWGYHLPTDIFNQTIIEDPYGIASTWKKRMTPYPDALRQAIFKRQMESLRYWRSDYHYRSKCVRKDAVFMASISARLINDIMQAIYAVNRFYFPGDGLNLVFTEHFAAKPAHLEERVVQILYPGNDSDCFERQYQGTMALIDDVISLLEQG